MSAIKNTSIVYIPDAGLSKFTEEDADNCVLLKATKVNHIVNGSSNFQNWIIQVKDSNHNTYEWRDYNLSSGASKTSIRTAIIEHLTNNVDKIPVTQLNEIASNLNSSTEGSSSEGVGSTLRDNATL